MTKTTPPPRQPARICVGTKSWHIAMVIGASALIGCYAQAGGNWIGGSGKWTDGFNWQSGSNPSSGSDQDVSFSGPGGISTNDYVAYVPWRSILFNSGAGSYAINSSPGANWDLYWKIVNSSTSLQTVNIDAIAFQGSVGEFSPQNGALTVNAKDIYTNGHSLNVYGTSTLTINNTGGAGISQGGALVLQSGFTGSVVLSGNNTYTGATSVNGGALNVSGSILNSSATAVNNSGSLLLSGSGTDRLSDSAPVSLATGSTGKLGFDQSGATARLSETLGALTLSGSSVIDLGSESIGSVLRFADSSANTSQWVSGSTLSIYNWSGTLSGGGLDQLFFGNSSNGLTSAQLDRILFYSDGGQNSLGGARILSTGELVPVPEPSTVFAAAALVGVVGWRERRRLWVRSRWAIAS